ncbi:MAG: hypothetical protein K6A94_13790 [Bacteroidales bacterium]|nr:hypothetical protein [Bacteroidales bacterium]
MKCFCSIGLLFVLALVACSPSNDGISTSDATHYGASCPSAISPELVAVDSLIWQQPDSAFALLIDFAGSPDADSLDESDLHYFQLLLSELLYKNDYEQTNRKDLLRAVAYYDSIAGSPGAEARGMSVGSFRRRDASHASAQTTAFLAARAHYINGVGCYERDSVVEACKEYLKALETMEGLYKEMNLSGDKARLMALVSTHITALFSDLYMHNQAVYFGKRSLEYFSQYEAPPRHIAWMLDELGAQYDMMDSYDTASFYYCKAIKILPDTNNITYRDIVTHLACLSYKKGGQLSTSLKTLKGIATKAESDKEFFSRCMNIGEVFYRENQIDSAWVYLSRAFHESPSINSKKQAAEWLVKICKAQGKDSEAHEFAEFLVPFANWEENQGFVKSQLTEQYKNYVQRRQEHVHKQERKKNIMWTLTIIGCLLVLLSSIAILYFKNRKKKQHLEMQIETERQAHQVQQKALSGRLRKSNEALQDALKQLDDNFSYNEFQSNPIITKNYSSFVETPICTHILETVRQQRFKSKIEYLAYKEYALHNRQLLALQIAADEKMGHFTIRLKKRYPGLTEEDITYCCLYLLDITDADIAALMQKAYPTVCERKRKIKRIVGEDNNLGVILRNLPD